MTKTNTAQEYTAGRPHYGTRTVYFLYATAERYHPAPEGGSYVERFRCKHDHPDTRDGLAAVQECAQSLTRILRTGRVPNWAVKDRA